MSFILVGKRRPTPDQPRSVTVVWDGTHEGSLLIGRAKKGAEAEMMAEAEKIDFPNAPVMWVGLVQLPSDLDG